MVWPQLPDYGCLSRWPSDDGSFIHPDDISIATRSFPSERVFRRERFDGEYYHYSYGKTRFRLQPIMWFPVRPEGFDVGDLVETTGFGFQRELFVARVWGMYYVSRKGCILYRLMRAGEKVPRLYAATHLRQLTRKSRVYKGDVEYPAPKWTGSTDIEMIGIDP